MMPRLTPSSMAEGGGRHGTAGPGGSFAQEESKGLLRAEDEEMVTGFDPAPFAGRPPEGGRTKGVEAILTEFPAVIDGFDMHISDPEEKADLLFVTLSKTEGHFSPTTMYADHAISPTLFQWESQNATAEGSPNIPRR